MTTRPTWGDLILAVLYSGSFITFWWLAMHWERAMNNDMVWYIVYMNLSIAAVRWLHILIRFAFIWKQNRIIEDATLLNKDRI